MERLIDYEFAKHIVVYACFWAIVSVAAYQLCGFCGWCAGSIRKHVLPRLRNLISH